MALSPIARSISASRDSTLLSRLLSLTTITTTPSAAADHFCDLLRSNPSRPNLERSLSQSKTKPIPSTITAVLSAAGDRVSALRFFVWAGLHPNHRHSAAAYAAASDLLRLPHHPHSLDHLLDFYHADSAPVTQNTFKILLNLCRAATLPDQALSLLRRMATFGCRPNIPSYNAVLRLLADARRGDECAALLQEMPLAGLRPDMVTYVSVIRGLCSASRVTAAKALIPQMRADGCVPNVVVYSALLDGACRCGDLDTALEVLEEMEKGMDGLSAPNVVSYTCLMKCLCEKGRADKALGVFDRMRLRGCSPNRVTVSTLVNGFCVEGRIGDALEFVERAVREGGVSSEECYSLLVMCLLRIGKMEEAVGLVERVLQAGVELDGSACNSLVRELCSRIRFLDGYSWIGRLEENGMNCIDRDVYSRVMSGLCEEGHLVEAAMLGREIVKRGIRLDPSCAKGVIEVLKMNGEGGLASELERIIGP